MSVASVLGSSFRVAAPCSQALDSTRVTSSSPASDSTEASTEFVPVSSPTTTITRPVSPWKSSTKWGVAVNRNLVCGGSVSAPATGITPTKANAQTVERHRDIGFLTG